MQEEIYQDDFESFLRDSVEDFKMYPTRKIWRGIYNDVHPAKKWPSLAMTLVLVGIILLVGISNNYRINYQHLAATKKIEKKVEILTYGRIYDEPKPALTTASATQSANQTIAANTSVNTNKGQTGYLNSIFPRFKDERLISFVPALPGSVSSGIFPIIKFPEIDHMLQGDVVAASPKLATVPPTSHLPVIVAQKPGNVDIALAEPPAEEITIPALTINDRVDIPTNEEALEISDGKLQGRQYTGFMGVSPYVVRRINRRNNFLKKLSYGFHITPSAGYRSLVKTNSDVGQPVYSNSLLNFNPARFFRTPELNHYAGINFEAGMSAHYAMTPRLSLRTGFQVNHSSYYIDAIALSHPTQAYLNVRDVQSADMMLIPVVTNYASEGNFEEYGKRLSNAQLQIGIPVGAEYKLTNRKKTNLVVAATVQPTLIARDQSNLLSYNQKNYAEAPNLVRKFNIHTGLELYAEYKTNAGINVVAGPQFRYQLRNTFHKEYNYEEKRYQLGFKIGFTKPLFNPSDK